MSIASLVEAAVGDAARLARNLRWGIKWGVVMSGAFCLFTIAGFILNGLRPPSDSHITLGKAFAVDVTGPLASGIILGIFRPLLRWRAAAIVIGVLAGAFYFAELNFLFEGPVSGWNVGDWVMIGVLGTVMGGGFANEMWEFIVEPTLRSPELPPGPAPKRPPLGLWKPR